jgi:hypothetical protein
MADIPAFVVVPERIDRLLGAYTWSATVDPPDLYHPNAFFFFFNIHYCPLRPSTTFGTRVYLGRVIAYIRQMVNERQWPGVKNPM